MPRFVGRPTVVEAHQWTGQPLPDAFQLAIKDRLQDGRAMVMTSDGLRHCASGDWIGRGPDGAFFVMRDAAFEAFFEPQHVEQTEPLLCMPRRGPGRPRKEQDYA